MSRETKLLKNTGIIAIGQLSSKILSFLLLPLYTNLLLPDDFGVVDVLQTTLSLILYFATLQLESAVFRFIIENRDNKLNQFRILSSSICLISFSNIVFTGLILLVNCFINIPHLLPFILSLWGLSSSAIMLSVSRGFGHNTLYSIASFCITITFLIINILLIVIFQIGAVSILWSLFVSNIIGALLIFIYEKVYKRVKIAYFNISISIDMLRYSFPLIPNAVSWWVANASDRFIIALFLGSTFNGVYAAANKITTIYLTLFNVFNLAWSESVILSINDQDRNDYINKIMSNGFKLFSFIALGIICVVGLSFELLIGNNYSKSYLHILILVIAIFFNSLCSMYGGIFTGFKDSKAISISTIVGAIVNIVVNISLIHLYGLYAASVSTLVSYIAILIMRIKLCDKYIRVKLQKSYIIQLVFVLLIVSLCYASKNKFMIGFSLILVVIWGMMNNKEIITTIWKNIFCGIKQRIN